MLSIHYAVLSDYLNNLRSATKIELHLFTCIRLENLNVLKFIQILCLSENNPVNSCNFVKSITPNITLEMRATFSNIFLFANKPLFCKYWSSKRSTCAILINGQAYSRDAENYELKIHRWQKFIKFPQWQIHKRKLDID